MNRLDSERFRIIEPYAGYFPEPSEKLMRMLYIVLLIVLLTAGASLHAQEDGPIDHRERARPSLDKDYYREKKNTRPYLLGSMPAVPSPLFLNRNTIVETGTQPPPQNESSIAINPLRPNVLIASAVDFREGTQVYISTDGGKSWTNKGLGLVRTGWQTGNDPSVAFDYKGHGYLMYGAFPDGNSTGESGVYLAKTTDDGDTWQPHIVVIEHVGAMTPDSAFEDKYYVEIDDSPTSPYRGNVYTPWKRVIDRDTSTQIVVARSTDGGLTWQTPVQVSPRKPGTSDDTTFGQSFPITTTGPEGTLYLAWNDGPIRSIGFAKSTDGGVTFSSPSYPVSGYNSLGTARKVGRNVYHVLKGTFRAETYPTMMADNSNSPRRGWLYLAWAADGNPNIYFIRSTDGGASWSTPKIIHSETANDQWWPWLSVDESNGDIAVMYSDSRNDPANILIDQYVSYSSDGGDTWIDRRVTDYTSDFRNNPFGDQIFAGDYSGNAFLNGKIYPSYLDTRETGARIDNDVFTALVDVNQPYPVEDLIARVNPDQVDQGRLSWRNPDRMETIFGKPIASYSLLVTRDGVPVATLPAGQTSYIDNGLTVGQIYTYTVRVVVGDDTSVARTASLRAGGAKEPGIAGATLVRDYANEIEVSVKIPGMRADSITPLANLKAIRVYRDNALLREIPVDRLDTGKVIPFTDTPGERGYYRYRFTVIDAATPTNESPTADTIIAYAGPLTPYVETLDATAPRFLATGTWAVTAEQSLSAPSSITDSPGAVYANRRSDYLQIYPVEMTAPIDLKFAHIAIIEAGNTFTSDTGFVEVSYDRGDNWSAIAAYTWHGVPGWADRTAVPADWRQAQFTLRHPQQGPGAIGLVRFRLKTGLAGQEDGWYIDNISFGQAASVLESDDAATLQVGVSPNPTGGAAIIEYLLPQRTMVRVNVFDVMGRQVAELGGETQERGRHAVTFDGSELPPGVYMYEVVTSAGSARGRIVVAR